MSGNVLTFDVSDSTGSYDGYTFSGFEEGTFIKLEPVNPEDVILKEGADKEAAFIVKKGGAWLARVTFMYTSDSNRVLSGLHYTRTKGVFEVEDSLGNRAFARQAMIQGLPAMTPGSEDPEAREWVFLLPNAVIKAPLTQTPV